MTRTANPAPTPGDAGAWEPHVFSVGDRVRVRLSAECRTEQSGYADCLPARRRITDVPDGHDLSIDGVGGLIERLMPTVSGHPYFVRFDAPVRQAYGLLAGGQFAGAELVPIEAGAEATGGGEG